MKWYKRDPDAFAFGTIGLTLQEVGAYTLILDAMYSREGPLPNDDIYLRAILRCHGNTWNVIKRSLILKGKIWISGEFLHAKRVEKQLKSWRKHRQKSKKANDFNENGPTESRIKNLEGGEGASRLRAHARSSSKFKTINGGRSYAEQHSATAAIDRLLARSEEGLDPFTIEADYRRVPEG
jgi:uncharacterized protein YdaU (DUF1376 family)